MKLMLWDDPRQTLERKKRQNWSYRLTINDAIEDIEKELPVKNFMPQVGIILGSGLGPLAKDPELEKVLEIPYEKISGFPLTTVEGHEGTLILGHLRGTSVAILNGRAHFYEYADEKPGEAMKYITLPTRVLKGLGIETLFVSNASGGLNLRLNPAELMLMTSYVNRMGCNPLAGMNDEFFGKRFPSMEDACDRRCADILIDVAKEECLTLKRGAYAAMMGPNYEFTAECLELRAIAHAVGMSSIPEIMAAKHGNEKPRGLVDRIIKTVGVSCVTNVIACDGKNKATHKEVIEAAKHAEEAFCSLVKGFLSRY